MIIWCPAVRLIYALYDRADQDLVRILSCGLLGARIKDHQPDNDPRKGWLHVHIPVGMRRR